jgi:hypothetical protein
MDQTTQLRQLIRESIQEYIREIDEAGNRAALEAKMTKTQEAIDLRKKKLNMEGLDEAYHDMMDKGKMKEMTSEIKMLEKSLAKYGKMLEKMDNKNAPKMEEMKDEDVEEEMIDEVNIDEYTAGPELEENISELTAAQSGASVSGDNKAIQAVAKALDKTVDWVKKNFNATELKQALKNISTAASSATSTGTKESVEEDSLNEEQVLHMQKLAGIISETEYKAKLEEISSSKKVQMLLNRLSELIPGQEQEFLEFMAKTTNSAMDYTGVDTSELANSFIASEEDDNDEEFNPELMNDVLRTYIPAFKSGDGIFEAKKKMTAAQKEKKEDIVKSMKKSKSFGKSKDEKAKMYATATKLATKKKAKSLKEEVQALFEENEKNIQSFGPKLIDGLKKNGFETNFITNDNPKAQELAKTSPKKLALVYFDKNTNFIQITTNKDNQDEALKVVDSPFVKESLPDNFTYKKQSSYFIEIQPK